MNILSVSNFLIRWGFYLLFFLVPIVFNGDTKELFEFNKMWLTFGLTLIIAAAWVSKMIVQKQIRIQRTLLDIPIVLFLLSQFLSTIFSLDPHVSWWGYYERFNGGFLSLLTYTFLYYAFASNLGKKDVLKMLQVSLAAGLFVALWGLPSHFGYDPSCFVFRGTLDVSCWTAAFQPKVRIFSTIGQPDWLAAYLGALLPIALIFGIQNIKKTLTSKKQQVANYTKAAYYFVLSALFYVDIIYTKSKGSFISLVIALAIFFGFILYTERKHIKLASVSLISIGVLLFITFFIGTPFAKFDPFTFSHIIETLQKSTVHKQPTAPATTPAAPVGELGGTDSGKIRLFVWQGALDAWLHNPLFGTGVETFAFAYYKYRPAGHNLTSEWDYLYNKAHNEYLNYLATTGAFGLATYLAFIFLFLFWGVKKLLQTKTKDQDTSLFLLVSLFTSFLTILISNFFGFSVVIINMYFFLIPLFALFIMDALDEDKMGTFPAQHETAIPATTPFAWVGITVAWLLALYGIIVLINFWNADKNYALGYNLDRAGQYANGYQYLQQAIAARTDEPVFWDEVSSNDAILAQALFAQKDTENATRLAQEALQASNMVVTDHPNSIVFWKTRVRVMYSLSQMDPKYLQQALEAIKTAHSLAPTDAKISYNTGLLYAQNGDIDSAIQTLQNTIKLKPDYRDAYYALGLLLHQKATDKTGKVIDEGKEKQATATLHYILDTLKIPDKQAQDSLTQWGEK